MVLVPDAPPTAEGSATSIEDTSFQSGSDGLSDSFENIDSILNGDEGVPTADVDDRWRVPQNDVEGGEHDSSTFDHG